MPGHRGAEPPSGVELPYQIGPAGVLLPSDSFPPVTPSSHVTACSDLHGDMVYTGTTYDAECMLAMGPYDEDFGHNVMVVSDWGGGRQSFGYFPRCAECTPRFRAGRFVVPSVVLPQPGRLGYLHVKALCWDHAKLYVGVIWPHPLVHLGVLPSQREMCFEPWLGIVSPYALVR